MRRNLPGGTGANNYSPSRGSNMSEEGRMATSRHPQNLRVKRDAGGSMAVAPFLDDRASDLTGSFGHMRVNT